MTTKSNRTRIALMGGVTMALSLTTHAAFAADAPAAPGPGASKATDIEEVVVTARKKTERLLDVPVSANALNTKALAKYATTDLTSLGVQIPQVSIDHAASGAGAIITIRGIGSASVDAAIEQEVTVNIDGVPISRGRVIEQAFFDQSSVEVLKGPQALYFGKNSPAGVISIASQDPGSTPSGYVRAGYEEGAQNWFGEAAFGGPIADGLSARAAFRYSDMTGGYVQGVGGPLTGSQLPAFLRAGGISEPGSPDTAYPGERDVIGRLTVKYKPDGSPFDATFKFLGSDHRDRGDSMDEVIWRCTPGDSHPESLDFGSFLLGGPTYVVDPYGSCGGTRTNSFGALPPAWAAGYAGSNGGNPYTDVLTYLSSLTMNYRFADHLTLTSVTGYYEYNEQQFSNYDETDMSLASGVNNDEQTSLSEEIRLQSSFQGPLNFTLGGFYGHDRRSFHQVGSIGYLGVDPATGFTNLFASIDYYRTDTYSGFGELSWKILPNVELAGGARYTSETKFGNDGMTYVAPLLNLLTANTIAAPVGTRFITTFTETNVSPQVTLSWHPSTDVMVYGAYKTGFKSGGFSTPALIPATATVDNQRFNQETAKGGEIGLKFSELDRRLTGDATLYRYTFSGLQLTAFDAATTSYFTQNAASATSEGAEFNINFQASPVFGTHASVGYSHARYGEFTDSQCWTGQEGTAACPFPNTPNTNPKTWGVQNLTGAPLSRAPNLVGLIGVTYDQELYNDYKLSLTGDVRYSSGYFLETSDNPFAWQARYATLDASARIYNGVWEFAVIGKNLTNTYYAVLGGDKPLSPSVIGGGSDIIAELGRPREVTFQVTRRF
jgi:outer membrane receptor protein involved in Fe transport